MPLRCVCVCVCVEILFSFLFDFDGLSPIAVRRRASSRAPVKVRAVGDALFKERSVSSDALSLRRRWSFPFLKRLRLRRRVDHSGGASFRVS